MFASMGPRSAIFPFFPDELEVLEEFFLHEVFYERNQETLHQCYQVEQKCLLGKRLRLLVLFRRLEAAPAERVPRRTAFSRLDEF